MTTIIGIDCAAQDKKCGIALGVYERGSVRVLDVRIKQASVVPTLLEWMEPHDACLLAIDAPLGWPRPLGPALVSHRAGGPLRFSPDDLFHRDTDREVRRRTGKRPMEVGADKIARAALRAVNLIQDLRDGSRRDIPLVWAPGPPASTSAIEVYPALTLRARSISDTGYKGSKPDAREHRASIVTELAEYVELPRDVDFLVASDDALDAVLCLLAAADYIDGDVVHPIDLERARSEGWIWFRSLDG